MNESGQKHINGRLLAWLEFQACHSQLHNSAGGLTLPEPVRASGKETYQSLQFFSCHIRELTAYPRFVMHSFYKSLPANPLAPHLTHSTCSLNVNFSIITNMRQT